MFSLIITIVSIALVAALALATIYYGGDAFTRGGDAARASQLINEGQQLQGANTLAAVDLKTVTDIPSLVSQEYLSNAPAGWTREGADGVFTHVSPTLSAAVCDAVNEKAAYTKATTAPADLAAAKALAVGANKVFVCESVGGANTLVYRF